LTSVYGDLYSFDTSKSSWTQINAANGPSPRAGHCGKGDKPYYLYVLETAMLIPNHFSFFVLAVQVNNTMFILFGYDFTLASLSDIHALDTVNMKWVTAFSASGYPLISNTSSSSNTTDCTDCSESSGLSTGAIAGIAVGCGVAAV
jgi:hypothetical protein